MFPTCFPHFSLIFTSFPAGDLRNHRATPKSSSISNDFPLQTNINQPAIGLPPLNVSRGRGWPMESTAHLHGDSLVAAAREAPAQLRHGFDQGAFVRALGLAVMKPPTIY